MKFYSERDVEARLSMTMALEAVETSLRRWAAQAGSNLPRRRLLLPHGAGLHSLEAAVLLPPLGGGEPRWYMGFKIYSTGQSGAHFLVGLYDGVTAEPLAHFEADRLGQRRTGAASGVATRLLAAPTATQLGVIGSGWQAESQVEAICAVRPIERVRVFSRDPERRQRFAATMSVRVGRPVEAVACAADALEGADIAVTATTSRVPVAPDAALANGCHVNAMGANALQRHELEPATLHRATRVVVDSIAQCRIEAGDLAQAFGAEGDWGKVEELGAALTGGDDGGGTRKSDNLTVFKSTGLALWDVACAARIFEQD